VGHAIKTGFRCPMTHRMQKRGNGRPLDHTLAPKVIHQICK
jgi:hypothetical protein